MPLGPHIEAIEHYICQNRLMVFWMCCSCQTILPILRELPAQWRLELLQRLG